MNTTNRVAALATTFRLSAGNHASPEEGMCAMELAAFLDGAQHTDHPRCVSEAIGDYVRHINDNVPDDVRQRLLPFAPRLIGTATTPEHEQARDEHFAWAAVRIFAPAALRAAGRRRAAAKLQAAPSLPDAKEIASGILELLQPTSGSPAFKPGWHATHRAYRAAGAAFHTRHGSRCMLNDGYTAGYCAASAACDAHDQGAVGIWEMALRVLEEALAIGAPEPLRQPTEHERPERLIEVGVCLPATVRSGQ